MSVCVYVCVCVYVQAEVDDPTSDGDETRDMMTIAHVASKAKAFPSVVP